MAKSVKLTIKNRLKEERRDISIYHHASRSSHIISPDSSITLTIEESGGENYLHISMLQGPGELYNECHIRVPGRVDFEFKSGKEIKVKGIGGATHFFIQPGDPAWELRLNGISKGVTPMPLKMRELIIADGETH